MTFEQITAKIEKFRLTGSGKGIGLCPAHDDKEPSLSVLAGEERTLIHCFAGCSIQEICCALNIELHDLFYEPKRNKAKGTHHQESALPKNSIYQRTKLLRESANQLLDIADAYHFHVEGILERARGLSIDGWTDEELDQAMDIVSRGNERKRLVDAIDDLAGDLKTWAIQLERNSYETRNRNPKGR